MERAIREPFNHVVEDQGLLSNHQYNYRLNLGGSSSAIILSWGFDMRVITIIRTPPSVGHDVLL